MQRLADTEIPRNGCEKKKLERNEKMNNVKQGVKSEEEWKTICGSRLAFVLRTPHILKESKRLQTEKNCHSNDISFVHKITCTSDIMRQEPTYFAEI